MNKHLKISIFLMLPALIVLCVYFAFKDIDTYATAPVDVGTKRLSTTGELSQGVNIKQAFTPKSDDITAIELFVGTYARDDNEGEWTISLFAADTAKRLMTKSVSVNDFMDNGYVKIPVPVVTGVAGRPVTMIFQSNSPQGKGATIYIDKGDSRTGELTVNGRQVKGALIFNLYTRQLSALSNRSPFALISYIYILLALLLYTFYAIFKRFQGNPTRLLAALLALFTMLKLYFLVYPDLNILYPFMFPDSYELIADGLHYAGYNVNYSVRPPALPLIIAGMERGGVLFLLPLLNQLVMVWLVIAIYNFLKERFVPYAALITGALIYFNFFLQDITYYPLADMYALLFIVLSVIKFCQAEKDVKNYIPAAIFAAISFTFQYAAFLLLPGYLIIILLFRREHLKKRAAHIAFFTGAAISSVWFLYRWRAFGDPFYSPKPYFRLVGLHVDSVFFYLFNLVGTLSIPVTILFITGLLKSPFMKDSGAKKVSLTMLTLLLCNVAFWVFIYDWNDRRFILYWSLPVYYFVTCAIDPLVRAYRNDNRAIKAALIIILAIVFMYNQLGYSGHPLTADKVALAPYRFVKAAIVTDGLKMNLSPDDLEVVSEKERPFQFISLTNLVYNKFFKSNDETEEIYSELLEIKDYLVSNGVSALRYLPHDESEAVWYINKNRFGNPLKAILNKERDIGDISRGSVILVKRPYRALDLDESWIVFEMNHFYLCVK